MPAPPHPLGEAADHLAAADPALGELIWAVGPCRLEVGRMETPFGSLLKAVVYQQLSGRAAATIYGRLAALFPGGRPTPEALLQLEAGALRAAGLSRAKAAAALDLAARTLDGTVPARAALEEMSDEEVVGRLTAVRGVGRWTVEMLLMFELGRPDVLPATDLGVRKGFARLHGLEALPTPAALLAHGERWRPHRSAAAWYLWRAAEMESGGP